MNKLNRWWIAIAGILMQVALGAVYAWSVFRAPLAKQFHWSISQITLTFTIAIMVVGFASFFGGLWSKKVGPRVVAMTGGVLYGVTPDGGTGASGIAFSLSPPEAEGGGWAETVLYNFPAGARQHSIGLTLGERGVLHGTTYPIDGAQEGGTVFSLSPPSFPGGPWTEAIIATFPARGPDAPQPPAQRPISPEKERSPVRRNRADQLCPGNHLRAGSPEGGEQRLEKAHPGRHPYQLRKHWASERRRALWHGLHRKHRLVTGPPNSRPLGQRRPAARHV